MSRAASRGCAGRHRGTSGRGHLFGRYDGEQGVDQQGVARRTDATVDEHFAAVGYGFLQIGGVVEDDDVVLLHRLVAPAVIAQPSHERQAEAIAPFVHQYAFASVQ